MTSKPSATRASSRTKTASSIPAATRVTRARTATAKSAIPSTTEVPPAPAVKKGVARKPPINKVDSAEAPIPPTIKTKAKAAPIRRTGKQTNASTDSEREPIMAYLRIRPRLGDEEPTSSPYLTPLSDTTVNMTDPQDPQNGRAKYRFSAVPPSSIYTFSHVFPPTTTQYDFFTKTTLPLVQDVLTGQNGLLFTYGVTNSGKTYTVQGGTQEGAAGILPRSLDVFFNSIEGLHGDGRYRPVRLHGIELADDMDSKAPPTMPEPALAGVLGSFDSIADPEFDIDPTVVTVDRNYEYSIWISYAEVYNERVYDLLASVKDESDVAEGANQRAAGTKGMLLTRQALPLRPSPAADNPDSESHGKYIAGLRQFRVHSASQAKAIIKLGQLHRRVFGTLANRESSRSHGMVIIKVVRGHRGERNDPTSLQISRLTLVDLAGSERTKHTHTTGDRLKEAGNINKSLMVLGQCMEVMRSNQRKLAASLSQETSGKDGRVDTRDVKRNFAVVPFRHSKLTEALMDYFVSDGRTVMIVNVNPYDTGYDENSHVMKFAALTREVYVTPAPAPLQRVPVVGPGNHQGKKIKQLGPLTLKDPDIIPRPYTRKVNFSMGGYDSGRKPVEAILEVREEDEPIVEPGKDDDDDDDPINPLVDALFDEVENLRFQLFESEMRCALIEAETREEVMREMEERMRVMETMYSRRLMNEFEANELKTDAKIDMLHQSGLFGSPNKANQRIIMDDDISEEEVDTEMSLVRYGEDENSDAGDDARSISLSPLAKKGKAKALAFKPPRKSSVVPQPIIEKRPFIPDPPMLPSDTEDAELTETEIDDEISSVAPSGATTSELEYGDEDEDEDEEYTEEEDEEYEEEEEIWEPPTPKPKKQVILSPSPSPSPQPKRRQATTSQNSTKNLRISKLAQDMDELNINGITADDSVVILSKSERNDDEDVSDSSFNLPVTKKKMRKIGNKPIITEEDITKATYAVDRKVAKVQGAGPIRRLGK